MYFQVSIGRPRTCDGIALFPVYYHDSPAPPYLTGRRADAMGVLVVKERPGAAAVPELVVRNDADLPVLLVGPAASSTGRTAETRPSLEWEDSLVHLCAFDDGPADEEPADRVEADRGR
ncbi:MAG: hypothetical protein E6G27_18330 [Actinobacteria bacterium]|nr:MAG: hypothetical protein E6G27_18330 [Actinomycetota bacterium]